MINQQVCKIKLQKVHLVQALGLAHGGLDVERTDVLPVLLQQGDEEVDGKHNVAEQFFVFHVDVADGHTEAEHLLQLELDGGADFVDLGNQVVGVGDWSRELASLVETWTQQTWNLLDKSFGSNESIVLLGQLLNKLLVLVELLQVLSGHVRKVELQGFIAMMSITQHAHAHVWTRNRWQLDGTAETLVTLWIVVLETNLEFNGLSELAWIFL